MNVTTSSSFVDIINELLTDQSNATQYAALLEDREKARNESHAAGNLAATAQFDAEIAALKETHAADLADKDTANEATIARMKDQHAAALASQLSESEKAFELERISFKGSLGFAVPLGVELPEVAKNVLAQHIAEQRDALTDELNATNARQAQLAEAGAVALTEVGHKFAALGDALLAAKEVAADAHKTLDAKKSEEIAARKTALLAELDALG